MITYVYNDVNRFTDLESLESTIRSSSISSSTLLWSTFNDGCKSATKPKCSEYCIQPCNCLLIVSFDGSLSPEDSNTLDNIVSNLKG